MIRRATMTRELETTAGWCRENLPAHSRLLVHDAGFISYATEFPLTDLVGLKSPASIRDHRELTWPSAGRRRAEALHRIARRNHVGYLIATQEWNQFYGIDKGLRKLGWKLETLALPSEHYRVYRLTSPGDRSTGTMRWPQAGRLSSAGAPRNRPASGRRQQERSSG